MAAWNDLTDALVVSTSSDISEPSLRSEVVGRTSSVLVASLHQMRIASATIHCNAHYSVAEEHRPSRLARKKPWIDNASHRSD